MADFVWTNSGDQESDERLKGLYDTEANPISNLTIHSNSKTTYSLTEDHDFVFVLGHCYYPGKTTDETLRYLLRTSLETEIAKIKTNLFGHYLAIVHSGKTVTIFGDYLNMRAIFYAADGTVISSSLSAVEQSVGASAEDLDEYKVFELCAMRHALYPGLLGNSTIHRNIHRLRPYEYIHINTRENTFDVQSCTFNIDNRKVFKIDTIARKLIDTLELAAHQPDLRESEVGATLTGGYDSRLVCSIVSRYYENLRLRTCVGDKDHLSQNDLRVAAKLANRLGLPQDKYETRISEELDDYYNLTEGCSPAANATMAQLMRNTHNYAVGFEGTLGSELFMPVGFTSIDQFRDCITQRARVAIVNGEQHLPRFIESLRSEFSDLQKHYSFAENSQQDWIRLFFLYNTASSFSSVRAAYNVLGMQMEPYFAPPVIETAFQIPASMWGDKRTIAGVSHVQKKAMAIVDYRLGEIMTFGHFDPMVPFSFRSLPAYAFGYSQHVAFWIREKARKKTRAPYVIALGGFRYASDGWNKLYTRRILDTYQVDMAHDS